jgi:hypothetical protein
MVLYCQNMTMTPTTAEVAELAHYVAKDGTHTHAAALIQLGDTADAAGMFPGSSQVLRDLDAPEAARARAFLTIARHWEQVNATASRWSTFERSFQAQAAQWSRHQKLRSEGTIAALWESRTCLDELRATTAQHAGH